MPETEPKGQSRKPAAKPAKPKPAAKPAKPKPAAKPTKPKPAAKPVAKPNTKSKSTTYLAKYVSNKNGSKQTYEQKIDLLTEENSPVLYEVHESGETAGESFLQCTRVKGKNGKEVKTVRINSKYLNPEANREIEKLIKSGIDIKKDGDYYVFPHGTTQFVEANSDGKGNGNARGFQLSLKGKDNNTLKIQVGARGFKMSKIDAKNNEQVIETKTPSENNTFGFSLSKDFVDELLNSSAESDVSFYTATKNGTEMVKSIKDVSPGFMHALIQSRSLNAEKTGYNPVTRGTIGEGDDKIEFIYIPNLNGYKNAQNKTADTVNNEVMIARQAGKTYIFKNGAWAEIDTKKQFSLSTFKSPSSQKTGAKIERDPENLSLVLTAGKQQTRIPARLTLQKDENGKQFYAEDETFVQMRSLIEFLDGKPEGTYSKEDRSVRGQKAKIFGRDVTPNDVSMVKDIDTRQAKVQSLNLDDAEKIDVIKEDKYEKMLNALSGKLQDLENQLTDMSNSPELGDIKDKLTQLQNDITNLSTDVSGKYQELTNILTISSPDTNHATKEDIDRLTIAINSIQTSSLTKEEIQEMITNALGENKTLQEEGIQRIIDAIADGKSNGLSDEQVTTILNAISNIQGVDSEKVNSLFQELSQMNQRLDEMGQKLQEMDQKLDSAEQSRQDLTAQLAGQINKLNTNIDTSNLATKEDVNKITNMIEALPTSGEGLTEEQVQEIITKAFDDNKQLQKEDVEKILNAIADAKSNGLSDEQVAKIINKLDEVQNAGLTKKDKDLIIERLDAISERLEELETLHTGTNTGDPVAGIGTDTGTDTVTDTGTDTGTSTNTGTNTGTDTGTDTGTSTNTGTDTGTNTGTDTGTDTGTGKDTEINIVDTDIDDDEIGDEQVEDKDLIVEEDDEEEQVEDENLIVEEDDEEERDLEAELEEAERQEQIESASTDENTPLIREVSADGFVVRQDESHDDSHNDTEPKPQPSSNANDSSSSSNMIADNASSAELERKETNNNATLDAAQNSNLDNAEPNVSAEQSSESNINQSAGTAAIAAHSGSPMGGAKAPKASTTAAKELSSQLQDGLKYGTGLLFAFGLILTVLSIAAPGLLIAGVSLLGMAGVSAIGIAIAGTAVTASTESGLGKIRKAKKHVRGRNLKAQTCLDLSHSAKELESQLFDTTKYPYGSPERAALEQMLVERKQELFNEIANSDFKELKAIRLKFIKAAENDLLQSNPNATPEEIKAAKEAAARDFMEENKHAVAHCLISCQEGVDMYTLLEHMDETERASLYEGYEDTRKAMQMAAYYANGGAISTEADNILTKDDCKEILGKEVYDCITERSVPNIAYVTEKDKTAYFYYYKKAKKSNAEKFLTAAVGDEKWNERGRLVDFDGKNVELTNEPLRGIDYMLGDRGVITRIDNVQYAEKALNELESSKNKVVAHGSDIDIEYKKKHIKAAKLENSAESIQIKKMLTSRNPVTKEGILKTLKTKVKTVKVNKELKNESKEIASKQKHMRKETRTAGNTLYQDVVKSKNDDKTVTR